MEADTISRFKKGQKQFYEQRVRNQSLMGTSGDLTSALPDTAVVGAGPYEGYGLRKGTRFPPSLRAPSPVAPERTLGSVAHQPDSGGHT